MVTDSTSASRPKGTLPWMGAALGLGVLALVRQAVLPAGGPLSAVAGLVLDVALLVVLGWTGRAASRAGLRPAWQGALAGLIYGVAAGLSPILFPPSAKQVLRALNTSHPGLPVAQAQAMVHFATSAVARLIGLGGAVLGAVLLGLLAGWVGSLLGRAARDASRAV